MFLPLEIVLHSLDFLHPVEVLAKSCVCKVFYKYVLQLPISPKLIQHICIIFGVPRKFAYSTLEVSTHDYLNVNMYENTPLMHIPLIIRNKISRIPQQFSLNDTIAPYLSELDKYQYHLKLWDIAQNIKTFFPNNGVKHMLKLLIQYSVTDKKWSDFIKHVQNHDQAVYFYDNNSPRKYSEILLGWAQSRREYIQPDIIPYHTKKLIIRRMNAAIYIVRFNFSCPVFCTKFVKSPNSAITNFTSIEGLAQFDAYHGALNILVSTSFVITEQIRLSLVLKEQQQKLNKRKRSRV
jgi:hypothetical protein